MDKLKCMLVGFLYCLISVGCTSTPRSTSFTQDDIDTMAIEMGESLRASDFLKERSPNSEPVVIALARVQNLTRNIVPRGQQWFIVEKLKDNSALQEIGRDHGVSFVIPAENLRIMLESGEMEYENAFSGRRPTHRLDGTLRSARVDSGLDQTEAYLCEFRLMDLSSGEESWTDSFNFKRVKRGQQYD